MLAAACALALAAGSGFTAEPVPPAVRALHERLLVLDSHLDTPMLFDQPGWSILDRHTPGTGTNHVDLPRMIEGGLDGGLWVIYTPQRGRDQAAKRAARDHGLRRLLQIHRLLAAHPEHFELALTPEDAHRIAAAGRRVVFISMENAAPLASDPSLLGFYHAQGLRVLGLVHTANNDFADSASTPPEWNGLSPAGRALVAEANRLGIVIDHSHASDAVFDQLLALSKAPILLSHTSADAMYQHPRNIDDQRLRRLAAQGGVIQVNSLGAYLTDTSKRPATFEDYMRHVLHIIRVAGPQHVGFGADWDGGGGVAGLEDVSMLPKITARLLEEGFTEEQIADMWGGNLLRVIGEAQRVARELTDAAANLPPGDSSGASAGTGRSPPP
jgi:membrane dipeptidase